MNILFVCTGNTCRSPMAQALLEAKKLEGINVRSAGLFANGEPISQGSLNALDEVGIDYSHYVSRQITADDIEWADRIYCLSPSHLSVLENTGKALLLGNGINDPFGGSMVIYRLCREQISEAIEEIASLKVSPAKENELESIAALEKECFSEPWSLNLIKDSFNLDTVFFVCKQFDTVIGYGGINVVLDEGYITNIAVGKEHRRKGVGTAIINALIKFGEEKGLSFITLEVRESNLSARNLYNKFSFTQVGVRKGFYSNPKEDAILLTRKFG